MNSERIFSSDVAFTASVKAIQNRRGSRRAYERVEANGSWPTHITADLKVFIEAQTSVFLATANLEGQPYIQHRGGPAGFLKVLDNNSVGFADFAGNRQYITLGNLNDNSRVCLFLIDYANRRRVKIWGNARVVESDVKLITELMPNAYRARPEQAIILTVSAWDSNCSQHIPVRLESADVSAALSERNNRILLLEAELERMRGIIDGTSLE